MYFFLFISACLHIWVYSRACRTHAMSYMEMLHVCALLFRSLLPRCFLGFSLIYIMFCGMWPHLQAVPTQRKLSQNYGWDIGCWPNLWIIAGCGMAYSSLLRTTGPLRCWTEGHMWSKNFPNMTRYNRSILKGFFKCTEFNKSHTPQLKRMHAFYGIQQILSSVP